MAATLRADVAAVRRTVARSGKAFSSDASSVCNSFRRASAPRRAQMRMSVECFAIPGLLASLNLQAQTPAVHLRKAAVRAGVFRNANITGVESD